MPATFEQEIVTEALARLAAISIVKGYSFNINGAVDEWRDIPYQGDALPAIDLRDALNEVSEEEQEERRLELIITLFDKGGTAPAKVREKAQDVLKAMKLLQNYDGIETILFLGSEKEIEKSAQSYSSVTLRFTVIYYANYFEV